MRKEKNKASKVGLLIFSSLIILIVTIYFIGSKNNLFRSKTEVYCVFKDIRGVLEGNQVQFSGIKVGTVKEINITSDTTVLLTLDIAEKYAQHIHKGFYAEINLDGLMGGKIISIVNKGGKRIPIADGDTLRTLRGMDIDNMFNMSNNILLNSTYLVENLNEVIHKINKGNGDLSKLLNENKLTNQLSSTLNELSSSLSKINQISNKINAGQGDLGTLINDKKITEQIKLLLTELNKTGKKADKTMTELQKTAQTINNENNSIHKIIKGPALANKLDSTITNINISLDQFTKTANAIERSWIINVFSKKKKDKNK